MAQGRPGGVGRRVPRDPRAAQPRELRHRQRRHAYHRPGIHDGVPGRGTACAGSRARSRRVRLRCDAPRAGRGAVGEAAGQSRSDPHAQALSRRAARHRPRHRLLDVPDVERLSGHVREPRHRQRGDRQAASRRDPAARDQRAHRPRRAARGGLRPGRRHAGGARRRRRHRAAARAAAGGQADRFHRQLGQRQLAGAQRAVRRRCSPRRPASTR